MSASSTRLVHIGCGGTCDWIDTNDVDEAYVCAECGQEVDGDDMEVERNPEIGRPDCEHRWAMSPAPVTRFCVACGRFEVPTVLDGEPGWREATDDDDV